MPVKPLTSIMIKPAGPDCNLACSYCFYRRKQALFPEAKTHRMADDVLEEMIRQLMERSRPEVSLVWQGGEPTLMGLPFYQKVVALEQKHGRGQVVGNGLQTNGLLLDRDWTKFFRQYRFLIGLSLDGPEHVHDHYRCTRDGTGTWSRTVERARMLLDEGVATNALIVVSDYAARYPEEIYDFHKDLGLTFMQFIPCVEPGEDGFSAAPFSVSSEVFGIFLCRLFDRWRADVQDGKALTSIRFFDALFHVYLGLEPPECTIRKECGDYVVVEHNGDVYACDFFVEPGWRLGNVMQDSLDAMLNGRRQTRFGRQKAALPEPCRSCTWLRLCRGGCLKDRIRDPRDRGLNHFCEGLQTFFKHADPHFREMVAQWERYDPRGTAAEGETQPRGPGRIRIGRNDPCPCGSGLKYKKCCGR